MKVICTRIQQALSNGIAYEQYDFTVETRLNSGDSRSTFTVSEEASAGASPRYTIGMRYEITLE